MLDCSSRAVLSQPRSSGDAGVLSPENCYRIRSPQQNHTIPVIGNTAKSTQQIKQEQLKEGRNTYEIIHYAIDETVHNKSRGWSVGRLLVDCRISADCPRGGCLRCGYEPEPGLHLGKRSGQPHPRAGSRQPYYTLRGHAACGGKQRHHPVPGPKQVVAVNSGSWQPLADGSDGSEPANYGGTATAFLTTGVAAVREARVDVTSGALAISDGRFDTQGLTFTIPSGASTSLSYRLRGANNSSG